MQTQATGVAKPGRRRPRLSYNALVSGGKPARGVVRVCRVNVAFAANCSHQPAVDGSSLVRGIKRALGLPAAHHMCYQPWLMDEGLFEVARHDASPPT